MKRRKEPAAKGNKKFKRSEKVGVKGRISYPKGLGEKVSPEREGVSKHAYG